MLKRPEASEYNSYYEMYISKVPDGDYETFLRRQLEEITGFFSGLTEEQGLARYAPGKWSLKELLGHMTDTERVMSYRMLRVARGDTTKLPGFDQDIFIENGSFDHVPLADLIADFQAVRQATFTLLTTIGVSAWPRVGNASTYDITARALAYVIAGHAEHHLGIARERYV
ncbi:DinB family protein [Paenibacillus sp. GCM10023248]|uniref:DinB family protein n=1 Tax=Bacillales TaxID=1385 RepID=UPI0023794265|nr:MULTISPECIES: DinB family protein [Bacillales]MDD9267469.1 DinB family protein [Paenibacillus sp. MAHUQ-63]MDR6882686.1 hypothetical protein [Bacillus sp. 3255]